MIPVDTTLAPYDGLLLISFGGPEGLEEVMPFLHRVTAGRGIPQSRLDQVAEHYYARGGISPINTETRRLAEALSHELASRKVQLPLEVGYRNSEPFVREAVARLAEQGATRVLAVTTSAYPSYSSCRQYLENLADAVAAVPNAPRVDRIRHYAHHPGFAAANAAAAAGALGDLGAGQRRGATRLVFVTHSLPVEMAETSGPPPRSLPGSYVDWHRVVASEVSRRVSEITGRTLDWDLAYCSRSGPADQEWLEPDINDHLEALAREHVDQVVLVPIGFTCDHMEVVYDLDTEAMATAERLGMVARRAATVGTHPAFVAGLADLMGERAGVARGEAVLPSIINHGSPGRHVCPDDCCPRIQRRAKVGG